MYNFCQVWSMSMMSREDVRRSVTDSLAHLQTDYLDLCLIQWPAAGVPFETNVNHEGMKERNPEYRRLVWDELTQLFKCAYLTILKILSFNFKVLASQCRPVRVHKHTQTVHSITVKLSRK